MLGRNDLGCESGLWNGLGIIRRLRGLCCLGGVWWGSVRGFVGGWVEFWGWGCLGLGLSCAFSSLMMGRADFIGILTHSTY